MKRVSKARQELKELQESDIYEHIVCNDDLDKAIAEVREIILTEMKK